ncbi:PHP domain-containing protein [bacterium]|nr:PHP domain-containing protein [bacterium]
MVSPTWSCWSVPSAKKTWSTWKERTDAGTWSASAMTTARMRKETTVSAPDAMIDLHAHSTASDGSLTPSELVSLARDSHLDAIALTDHDTIEGLPEAFDAGRRYGVEIVPGVEISAVAPAGQLHILGYLFDPDSAALHDALQWMQQQRASRNPRLAQRLRELGIPVEMEHVKEIAGTGQVGRPHFARALVELDAASDIEEAFQRYIGEQGIAYIPKTRMEPERAFDAIRAAGGLPVVAHPIYMERHGVRLEEHLPRWIEMGLAGLEVYYSAHSERDMRRFDALVDRFGLIKTGGSDYHGDPKPDIRLGTGFGNLRVPYRLLDEMRSALPVSG